MPIAYTGRVSRALLAGAAAVALQQWTVSYQLDLFGVQASASLAHLHTGLLLALAMAFQDRIYLRSAFVFSLAGWFWRAWAQHYAANVLILTSLSYPIMYGWTAWCARWMGWPRGALDQRVGRGDITRFAIVGLLLYPLGWAASDYLASFTSLSPNAALNDAIQTLFAKHFGVSVVALPLLYVLTDRAAGQRYRGDSIRSAWTLLLLGLGVNLLATFELHRGGAGMSLLGAILDYRFAIVALLTVCVVRLAPRLVMPVLITVQLLLLFSLAQSYPRMGQIIGAVGLAKVAFELCVLQSLMVLLVIIKRDRDELIENLREESQHEAITGLPNLNGLVADLRRAAPPPPEIAYLTLANLDRLIGAFGLHSQEFLMQGVARHVSDQVESYHMGTGQFVLVPRQVGALMAWDRVLQRLEQYDFHYGGETLRLTPYLGVAPLEGVATGQIDLALNAASTAAQDAALRGETHVVRTHPAKQQDTSVADRDILAVASRALAHVRARELKLYFQPIKRIAEPPDQPVRYGEVLCRLGGADGNLLMPGSFLPALGARGRLVELDLAVVECLFDWLREHAPNAKLPRISINVTGRGIASESFRETLLRLVDATPVPLTSLSFEVTEAETIERFSDARRLLSELRARGCHIALDDFGIGAQSFERLRELPFDLVKIDGSFVRGVTARGRDYDLIRASVAVARAYSADTVAEYVENAEITACLKELGVSWGQGDYFGAAMPLDTLLANGMELA